ncbi:hypothetical protein ACIRPP_28475 [Streptomyces sp. NPDC101219]|uniref:hypothetical protein n=1 Tax=Streptomyces sp. NPDC101219 TaxID=3366131 RepID=UPI003826F933
MRIRSALAVAVLAAALTTGGVATAQASDHHGSGDDHATCSPYFGEIETDTAEIEWGGANCHG